MARRGNRHTGNHDKYDRQRQWQQKWNINMKILDNDNSDDTKHQDTIYTHWGLDEHGPLVPHLLDNLEHVHGLVGLDCADRRLHGNEHPRPADPRTAVDDHGLGRPLFGLSNELDEVEEVGAVVGNTVVGPGHVLHLMDVVLLLFEEGKHRLVTKCLTKQILFCWAVGHKMVISSLTRAIITNILIILYKKKFILPINFCQFKQT